MTKIFLLLSALVLSFSCCLAQSSSDSIIAKKVWGGYQFIQNGELLSMGELKSAVRSNPLAYSKMKSARATTNLAYALSFGGGFLAGYAIGAGLSSGEYSLELAGLGVGLIVASVPISTAGNRKAKEAIDIYNSGLRSSSSFWNDCQLRFAMTGNGVGLALSF